jgi:hypothetical protein
MERKKDRRINWFNEYMERTHGDKTDQHGHEEGSKEWNTIYSIKKDDFKIVNKESNTCRE